MNKIEIPYKRLNHFVDKINEENQKEILNTRLIMNGYISKGTIEDYLKYMFKNVSLSFDNHKHNIYPMRKNFFSYPFFFNKIINSIENKSVMSKETKEQILSMRLGKELKSFEKLEKNEKLWKLLKCDDNFKIWEQTFLIDKK